MIRMFAASALDCGSNTQSSRINTMTMSCTCYFNARHTTLRSKSTDWLVASLENMSEWSDMSTCFHQYLTCSCHDKAVYMFIWRLLTHSYIVFSEAKTWELSFLFSESNAVYYNKCYAHWQEYLTGKKTTIS